MQHPIITLTGYIIGLCGAIFVGMVIGYSVQLERVAPTKSAPDHVPSPKVFRGIG
jgi:ABC-type nitrate/sulfonate/bicarbonate transport system permease component